MKDQTSIPFNVTMVSHLFWPPFREEALELPDTIKKKMQDYLNVYRELKPNRSGLLSSKIFVSNSAVFFQSTLVWKPHLGNVELELEFEGQTKSFSVNPTQAAIIVHFQDQRKRAFCRLEGDLIFFFLWKAVWELQDLADKLHIPVDIAKKRIAFWINQGVIREVEKNKFQLLDVPLPVSKDGRAKLDFMERKKKNNLPKIPFFCRSGGNGGRRRGSS